MALDLIFDKQALGAITKLYKSKGKIKCIFLILKNSLPF